MSNALNTMLSRFEPICLEQMDAVKLMNRVDRKFRVDLPHLEIIMRDLVNHYYVLEDEGERSIKYKSTYYDTQDDMLYMHHHNGKENRFKVRKRNYVTSNRNYLEIKFKTADGRTIKERILTGDNHHTFNANERAFIELWTQLKADVFHPCLESNFYRITLVNKYMAERVTIDIKPAFKSKEGRVKLNDLVVIEVKNDAVNMDTLIINKLADNGFNKSRFSKYCVGRALLNPKLKQNQFKSQISSLGDKNMGENQLAEQLVLASV